MKNEPPSSNFPKLVFEKATSKLLPGKEESTIIIILFSGS